MMFESERPISNFKPGSTEAHSLGKSMGAGIKPKTSKNGMSQSKGNFSYWKTV